jgi:hypothetical protein
VFQLVTRHLYFGVDAMRLRDASERVLTRVQGQPPERATVGLDTLAQDFRLSVRESLTMVDQMVQSGLLERRGATSDEYAITDKFRQYAQARIVEPLPRQRALLLLSHMPDLAEHFNRTASRNKYEIDALAVYGKYMSREPELAELSIGVTGRRRMPHARAIAGRATVAPTAGHEQIRKLFEELSSFVRVKFFQRQQDIPRPFSVIFRDEG